jgi:hypothetical protein
MPMTDNSKFVQIAAATQGGRTSALYALDSEGIVWMLDDHQDVWRRVSTKRAPVD